MGILVAVVVVVGIAGYFVGTSGAAPAVAPTTTVMSTATVTGAGGTSTTTVLATSSVTSTVTTTTSTVATSVSTVGTTVTVTSTFTNGVHDDDGDGV